ncbi:hypothetical protein MAPG_04243 [Magnaporthiopsis poae ATCC 64411]|uniref:Cyanovirin-N domain-containing protein n=1 Tax=Magnaporthiopsis poae (strain ATCC 64411 / 73-15) TaxID=644358 RepID=A0A0C4DW69_MAGP6|nr:hypothetical protein MAPG_04243 [Magnaporthiopsis poae ATCC 64411]
MSAGPSRRHTPPHATLAVLSLLLLTATSVGAAASSGSKRAFCLASRSAELAELASCGHKGSISYCLSAGGLSQTLGYGALIESADLEHCFVDAGCTAREAAVEADQQQQAPPAVQYDPFADPQTYQLYQQQQQQQYPAQRY